MKEASKRARSAYSGRTPSASPSSFPTSQARRQAAAILEVLAGMLRPAEAARVLEVSLPRYYQLEHRALVALVAACEPVSRGPRNNPTRQIAVLQRENHRLRRECDRQQALVRAAERSLGLAQAKEQPQGGSGSPRRRKRRPTVRALKAARTLRAEMEAAAPSEEVTVAETNAPTASGA